MSSRRGGGGGRMLVGAQQIKRELSAPGSIVVLYSNQCGHCMTMKGRLGSRMDPKFSNRRKVYFHEHQTIDPESAFVRYYPTVFINSDGKSIVEGSLDDVYESLE